MLATDNDTDRSREVLHQYISAVEALIRVANASLGLRDTVGAKKALTAMRDVTEKAKRGELV